jgi:flagellar biosynthetic protein FliR
MFEFGLTLPTVLKFFVIFARLASIMVILPFFGERGTPIQVKLGLAALLAVVMTPLIPVDESLLESVTLWGLAISLIQSILAGLLIGFVPLLLFAGIQLGGEIAGFQMGFAIVSVMDPLSQARTSLIAQFNYILAILVFITINGHLYLMEGILKSFQVMPLLGSAFPASVGKMLISFSSEMFVIGLKIAAPVLVAILLTNVGLGILARMLPQMNIFIVGFPVQIGIGLITLGMSVPTFVYVFEKMFYATFHDWQMLIKAF